MFDGVCFVSYDMFVIVAAVQVTTFVLVFGGHLCSVVDGICFFFWERYVWK